MHRNIITTNSTSHFFNGGIRGQVIDGQKLYGVTSVLSNTRNNTSLNAWYDRVGTEEAARICKEATDFGSKLHKYIENYLLQDIPIPEHVNGNYEIVKAAKLVLSQIQEINLVEYSLHSEEFGYCGTCDALVVIHNELTLIDWKTSKKAKCAKYLHDYKLQAAAYRQALRETLGIDVKEARIFLFLRQAQSFQQVRIKEKELDKLFTEFTTRVQMFQTNLTIKNKNKWLRV